MAPLQIKVLGELAVTWNGRDLVLPPSKKTRALLAYLAVVNRRQRRDHLCQMLWDTPDEPRASLRWSLSKLRQLLAAAEVVDCLQSDRDTVFLDTSGLDVDLPHVARIDAKDMAALATSDLEALAARFGGRFLAGLELPRCPVFEILAYLSCRRSGSHQDLDLAGARRAPEG